MKGLLSAAEKALVLDWMRDVKSWEVECTKKTAPKVCFKEGGVQVMNHDGRSKTKGWTLIDVLRKYRDEIAAHYGCDLLVKGAVATAKPSSAAVETIQAYASAGRPALVNGAEPTVLASTDFSKGGTLKTKLSAAEKTLVLNWFDDIPI